MKRKSSVSVVVSRMFLAFLASVFLFGFLILLSLRLTLFSKDYMEKQAEKADYYTQLTKEINRNIENSALGSNIPEGILAEAVDEKLVKEDVDQYFSAVYGDGSNYKVKNTQNVKTSVDTRIRQYASEKGIEITPESEQSIQALTDRSAKIYDGYIELPFLISYGKRVMSFKNKLVLFMIVCGVLWCIMSFILFHSLRGYLHRLFRFWEYICAGGGLMLLVFPSVILIQGVLKRIAIQSKPMYDFIQTYLSSFLWMFIWMGIAAVAVGLVFAILSEYQRKHLFRQ